MKEQLEKLIETYSSMLKTMKENLANEQECLTDDEYNKIIWAMSKTAEMSRDLQNLLKILIVESLEV